MKDIEVKGSTLINWFYPQIYEDEKTDYLEINMLQVRASDSIRIHYDAKRDGWAIEQAAYFAWDVKDPDCDPDWQEVAFVQAWAREKTHPSITEDDEDD